MGIGLVAIVVILLYVLFWIGIVSISKPRWLKIATVVAAVAVPFWDWPIGFMTYQYYCATEGGVRVLKKFEPQDKVFLDGMPVYSANELLQMGFKVVEVVRLDGKGIARHETGDGNIVITRQVESPESKVKVSISYNEPVGWNVFRADSVAIDRARNEVLAQYSEFDWYGGWMRNYFLPVYFRCSAGRHDPIVRLVLKGA